GMARELINRVQNIRKDSGLEITDRINVTITENESVQKAVDSYQEYIMTQVLADSIVLADNDGTEVEIDELKLNIKVEKR
ncbi:DUF5915 domain-containing protein, partial [Parabacteroides distasonis]